MEAIIVSIGTELTLGQTVDTNTAWLAERLAEIGVPVRLHLTVSDDLEPIRRELDRAAEMADVVLVTGGIGPTEDDLTRQALAAVMHVELELRQDRLAAIKAFFAARHRDMPEANKIQAMFPAGTEPMPNICGTAPGIHAKWKRAQIFVMPGVPHEMKAMYDRSVLPVISKRASGAVILATTLYCFGVGESEIGDAIRDLMRRGRNPTVGTTAQRGVIGVRIHAHGCSREEGQRLLDETAAEVRRRLGTLIFGEIDDRLAREVGRLLKERRQTMATAESCTGGLLSKLITDVPGSSDYFLQGLITYANEAKSRLLGVPAELIARHGAVSREVAEAMAVGCRQYACTDYAISITGVAGPDGGTAEKPVGLVYIGLADAGGCTVTEHRLGETTGRDEIRERTCKAALNRLRLKLLEM